MQDRTIQTNGQQVTGIDPSDEFARYWETLELSDESGAFDRTRTIRPSTRLLHADSRRDDLPRRTVETSDGASEYRFKKTLGQGGMGEVVLAEQLSLARDVAIKRTRESSSEEQRNALLRESWVTGILQHPNIVPVYDLGVDEHEGPLLVMKRIEGVSWAELLADPDNRPRTFESDDPLDWHLDIFTDVCNAVHFAHSRGVIHLDLKPENVMIGGFGEVYVVDWGIAVSLDDAPDGRFPTRSDVSQPAGTPVYMAPEMVMCDVENFSPRTDVFLLGGILHEILTGRPPHGGETMYQIMYAAYSPGPFEFGDEVDPELADICRKALSQAPEDRYESADALRVAIARHIGRRDSRRLSGVARRSLDELRELLEDIDEEEDGDDEVGHRVYRVFGECRFGFEQALEVSPDNESARAGLQETLSLMARRELDRGSSRAAALLIADLPEPDPELEARLTHVSDQLELERRELEELREIRRDVDIEVGRHTKSLAALVVGLVWGTVCVATEWLSNLLGIPINPQTYAGAMVPTAALYAAVVYVSRRALFANSANTRLTLGMSLMIAGALLLRMLSLVLDTSVSTAVVYETLLIGVSGSAVAITQDRRIFWASVPLTLGAVPIALFPDDPFKVYGVAFYLAFGLLARAWWPEGGDG